MYNMLDIRRILETPVAVKDVQKTSGLMRKTAEDIVQSSPDPRDAILNRIKRYQEEANLPLEEESTTNALDQVMRPVSRADAGMEPPPTPGTLEDLSAAREAIAAVESRGSGDYAAVGPVVEKGMYAGQRAYGRYQVMEANIGPWTEEALGRAMTREEFMNDAKAQDAVVEFQLKKSFDKFGTYDDAASVWFSGQPTSKSQDESDGFLSAPDYIRKFRRNFQQFRREEA